MTDLLTFESTPPTVENHFDHHLPEIYTRVTEPVFDWSRFRRSQLQFKVAESIHDSDVYSRSTCPLTTSFTDPSVSLAHAANEFSQVKIDGSINPISSCPCIFCRKHFTEKERPAGLPSVKDLKKLFPTRNLISATLSPPTMTYLSRPNSAPNFQATFPLDQTFATRYVPTYKRISRPNGVKEEIFDVQPVVISKSAIPHRLGMRLDAEPNHDHTEILNLPRERNGIFRNIDDYFNMSTNGRPTMIL